MAVCVMLFIDLIFLQCKLYLSALTQERTDVVSTLRCQFMLIKHAYTAKLLIFFS